MSRLFFTALLMLSAGYLTSQNMDGYKLVWADEFEKDGKPDAAKWGYERGFVRNNEAQWYQQQNARCKNGILTIAAKKVKRLNPRYEKGSANWTKSRKTIDYTSACLITAGKQHWQYGRFEMRGRIDISDGMWPA